MKRSRQWLALFEKTEQEGLDRIRPLIHAPRTKGGAITKAAAEVGEVLGAKYLVTFTQSGDSARRISRLRSRLPILLLLQKKAPTTVLRLSWGIEPMISPMVKHTDDMVLQADRILIDSKRAAIGEQVMIIAGAPPGIPGSTNAMRVHTVGDAVNGVVPAYK